MRRRGILYIMAAVAALAAGWMIGLWLHGAENRLMLDINLGIFTAVVLIALFLAYIYLGTKDHEGR